MPELCTLVALMDRQQQGDGGPDPCEFGTWDFQEECQSAQMMTAGMM